MFLPSTCLSYLDPRRGKKNDRTIGKQRIAGALWKFVTTRLESEILEQSIETEVHYRMRDARPRLICFRNIDSTCLLTNPLRPEQWTDFVRGHCEHNLAKIHFIVSNIVEISMPRIRKHGTHGEVFMTIDYVTNESVQGTIIRVFIGCLVLFILIIGVTCAVTGNRGIKNLIVRYRKWLQTRTPKGEIY